MRPHLSSSVLYSVIAHGVLVVVAAIISARLARAARQVSTPEVTVEFSLLAPPPRAPTESAPVATANPSPARAAARSVSPPARAAHRALVEPAPRAEVLVSPTAPPNEVIQLNPEPPPARPASPPLTAADLYSTPDSLAAAAARSGGVDLGTPNGGYRPSRDLFGGHHDGYDPAHVREVAAGPTLAALDESHHMQPAGSGRHDSSVATHAAESFSPVRTIANLGNAVMRAPTVSLPPVPHQNSAAEVAATEGLDIAHGSSFTMMQMATIPPPSSHVVRAEVEVNQDRTGAIVAANVVTHSGVPGFDDEAVRAIREALSEVAEVELHEGRQTRWSFEVSNAQGMLAGIVGGGNEGWHMLSETSNGVQLRYRVRMVRARPWTGS